MDLKRTLQQATVIPILTIEDEKLAVPLARALCAGGLNVLEVTLRTQAALHAIEQITAEVEETIVGAGTVTNRTDLGRAADAGARFAVSPGFAPDLAQPGPIPLLPGVATATEIMIAQSAGFDLLKFFPAMAGGGIAALKAMAGPFADILFCATGGIDMSNAASFLALPNVACVGGSWMVPRNAIAGRDWKQIRDLAQQAMDLGKRMKEPQP